VIARDERMHALWLKAVRAAHQAYLDLVEGLMEAMPNIENKTERRKRVREAARSVLPNATETMIFCSANARALRHFIELRGAEGAEAEVGVVGLGSGTQDAVVLRQVALRERRHDAPGAGAKDAQHHFVADRGGAVQPGVLGEAGLARRLDNDVRPEPSHLEAALRVE